MVDVRHVGVGEHGGVRHVAELRDFGLRRRFEFVVGAADEDVGLEADAPKLLDGVLSGLRLLLAVLRVGDERDVGEKHVAVFLLGGELAERFEERHRLDVTDGAADLDDTHVGALGSLADAALDVVRDVRDNLDRLPR